MNWTERRELLTRAGGFVGEALCNKLLSLRANVTGYELVRPRRLVKFPVVFGSVTNYTALCFLMSTKKIDVVYHLAAQALVTTANKLPMSTFETNIKGTWCVLEACRHEAVSKVVAASSDKCYGTPISLPYTEEHRLQASAPYDVSKACADMIAQSYFKSFALPVRITRCANIYGPGDTSPTRLIPQTIASILKNEEPVIRSDGKFERDYMYIDDAVNAYIKLAEADGKANGEAFNFGTNKPVSVIQIVEQILDLMKSNLKYIVMNQVTNEIKGQSLDWSKAKHYLNWKPEIELKDGLRKTIEWHRTLSRG